MIIRSLLIANRGEIAKRVISTCRKLGIESVLAVSEADRDSVPARLADRIVLLGPAQASASYLDAGAVVRAAKATGVDALHPGYGFLAENAALARGCSEAGIVFVGPDATLLERLGDKLEARRQAAAAGLPLVPGQPVAGAGAVAAFAAEHGFPVLLKATAGGGGKGMTRIDDAARIDAKFATAAAESRASFGDDRLYVERYVENGRHVEVQVLGDGRDVIHFGDRDCSTQRRYQKLIEEAPAPGLSPQLRGDIHTAALRFARHVGYRSLGTVEFLVDMDSATFYFLEMNARIQVEHPVTEAVTGIDLVAEQLAVASGQPLRIAQQDVRLQGHAIECRINAEDPSHAFRPSPGRVTRAVFPAGPGIRVDTHIERGAIVPPHYDSLIAKVIVHGEDRASAIRRLRDALGRCEIDGVTSNVELQRALIEDAEFRRGGVNLHFLDRHLRGAA